MDRQVYIRKDGKMITKRNWKLAKRLLFWIGLQVAWGVICVLFNLKFRPHHFWKVLAVQWPGVFVLWYLQVYSVRIRGMSICFKRDCFNKWDVIKADTSSIHWLIFKKSYCDNGVVVYRGFPFLPSHKRWKRVAWMWWFWLLITLKLIK